MSAFKRDLAMSAPDVGVGLIGDIGATNARFALVLPGGLTASTAQCESMLVGAIHACERYYPALQFVVWAGKTASEAMTAAMFDTEGEA